MPAALYAKSNERNLAGAIFLQLFEPRYGDGVDVAIIGAPMDDLVSDAPGARFWFRIASPLEDDELGGHGGDHSEREVGLDGAPELDDVLPVVHHAVDGEHLALYAG